MKPVHVAMRHRPEGTTDMDDRKRLHQRFNRTFAHWEIELPVDAMSPGQVWFIVQRGWTIWTRLR